jgi:hypothetical protein
MWQLLGPVRTKHENFLSKSLRAAVAPLRCVEPAGNFAPSHAFLTPYLPRQIVPETEMLRECSYESFQLVEGR